MKLAFALTLLTTSLLASTLSSGTVRAQGKYPDRSVKIVVPYPAGGPTDIVARLLADRLGRGLGGNFIVENVAGASATLGARAVGAAAPDGYSLLLMTQDFLVQPLVKASVPYDPVKGFVPVSLVGLSPEGIYVNPSVPAKTIAELIAVVKANPGKYSYASPGLGTTPHLAGERLFKLTNSVDIVHVPFQGAAPAINATLGNHTQVLLIAVGAVAANVGDGSLRALAVGSTTRWPTLPDVPTMTESGLPNHEAEFIVGMMAPTGTPATIVSRLSAEIAKAMTDDEIMKKFEAFGIQPVGSTPEQLAAKMKEVSAGWAKVVQGAKISAQ